MGERTMKRTMISTVDNLIAAIPAAARPLPISPPMSACDEDVGRPECHVIRFQAIAPTRPERMMKGTREVST